MVEDPWNFVMHAPEDTHYQDGDVEWNEDATERRRKDAVIEEDEIDDSPVDLDIWIAKGMPDWGDS